MLFKMVKYNLRVRVREAVISADTTDRWLNTGALLLDSQLSYSQFSKVFPQLSKEIILFSFKGNGYGLVMIRLYTSTKGIKL